jgi:hypothetical protein
MKILVFLVLLVAGWYFLTWIQQLGAAARQGRRRTTDRRGNGAQRTMRATDTMICKRCGTYVPSEFPTACDRKDCPFPGVG